MLYAGRHIFTTFKFLYIHQAGVKLPRLRSIIAEAQRAALKIPQLEKNVIRA